MRKTKARGKSLPRQTIAAEDPTVTDFCLDTEFNEDGETIDLISIALVSASGREFYACSTDARLHRVNPWVRANVLPHLPAYGDPAWMSRDRIKNELDRFVRNEPEELRPRFWAYYADYDWVALCQLYGTMMDLPSHFPKYCMDLKQYAVMLGDPQLPGKPKSEHHALADARWNMDILRALRKHR